MGAEVEGFTEMKVRTFRNKLVDMGCEIKNQQKINQQFWDCFNS